MMTTSNYLSEIRVKKRFIVFYKRGIFTFTTRQEGLKVAISPAKIEMSWFMEEVDWRRKFFVQVYWQIILIDITVSQTDGQCNLWSCYNDWNFKKVINLNPLGPRAWMRGHLSVVRVPRYEGLHGQTGPGDARPRSWRRSSARSAAEAGHGTSRPAAGKQIPPTCSQMRHVTDWPLGRTPAGSMAC